MLEGYKDMYQLSKELMKLALEKRIAHGRSSVICCTMDNIYIKTVRAENIKLDKEKSTEEN